MKNITNINQNASIVRMNLWVLEATNLSGQWMTEVHVDFIGRKIAFAALEAWHNGKVETLEWIEKMKNNSVGEELTLTTFNEDNNPLYHYTFKDIKVIGDEFKFDYDNLSLMNPERQFVFEFGSYDYHVYPQSSHVNPATKEDVNYLDVKKEDSST